MHDIKQLQDFTSRARQTSSPIQNDRKVQETAKYRAKDEANKQRCSRSRFTIPAHQMLNARARLRQKLQRRKQSSNTTKYIRLFEAREYLRSTSSQTKIPTMGAR